MHANSVPVCMQIISWISGKEYEADIEDLFLILMWTSFRTKLWLHDFLIPSAAQSKLNLSLPPTLTLGLYLWNTQKLQITKCYEIIAPCQ